MPIFGICKDDKDNPGNWKYEIGSDRKYVKEVPDGFEILKVPSYTWAIFKCTGAMPKAIQDMWRKYIANGFHNLSMN